MEDAVTALPCYMNEREAQFIRDLIIKISLPPALPQCSAWLWAGSGLEPVTRIGVKVMSDAAGRTNILVKSEWE